MHGRVHASGVMLGYVTEWCRQQAILHDDVTDGMLHSQNEVLRQLDCVYIPSLPYVKLDKGGWTWVGQHLDNTVSIYL